MHEITHTTDDAILHGRRRTTRRWKARKKLKIILANQRNRRGRHAARRARRRKFTFFAIIFEITCIQVCSPAAQPSIGQPSARLSISFLYRCTPVQKACCGTRRPQTSLRTYARLVANQRSRRVARSYETWRFPVQEGE